MNPFLCPKCSKLTYTEDGHVISTIWVCQEIDGKMQIQRDLPINGSPMYMFHDGCQP